MEDLQGVLFYRLMVNEYLMNWLKLHKAGHLLKAWPPVKDLIQR